MTLAHAGHEAAGPPSWPVVALAALALLVYLTGVVRLQRRGDRWPWTRTAATVVGVATMAAGEALPQLWGDEEFRRHVGQHLLISAYAPLLLALGAPVTLALRTLGSNQRSLLLRTVHSRTAQLATMPAVILTLHIGGLYAFYLTPLWDAAHEHAALHIAVHLHMVVAGSLLAWYLVGPDPMPRRGSLLSRLIVLVVAAGAHQVLAMAMYAHTLPRGAGTAAETRAGAQLMYYGGDGAEILLAVALLAGWYARGGRELARERRRAQPITTPAPPSLPATRPTAASSRH